jgi:hypothetical protein
MAFRIRNTYPTPAAVHYSVVNFRNGKSEEYTGGIREFIAYAALILPTLNDTRSCGERSSFDSLNVYNSSLSLRV